MLKFVLLKKSAGGDIVERVHSAGVFTEAAAVRYSRQVMCVCVYDLSHYVCDVCYR